VVAGALQRPRAVQDVAPRRGQPVEDEHRRPLAVPLAGERPPPAVDDEGGGIGRRHRGILAQGRRRAPARTVTLRPTWPDLAVTPALPIRSSSGRASSVIP